jgi:Fur family zinc uptake transcriptional regulator
MQRKSRNTKQKKMLNEEIKCFKTFFTAEDLLKKFNKKETNLSIATIYRYLNELVKGGEIHSYICNRRTLYSKGRNSHCHYICEKTGRITHFEIGNLDFLKHVKDKIPGTINSFQLEIKGICDDCK